MGNDLTLREYSERAGATAVYPNRGGNLTYPVLGLCGEAGEVAEKVKKIFRDCGGVVDAAKCDAIAKELGDVLWYVAATAHELGVSLEDVASRNLDKLASRKDRGKLTGSGDER